MKTITLKDLKKEIGNIVDFHQDSNVDMVDHLAELFESAIQEATKKAYKDGYMDGWKNEIELQKQLRKIHKAE